MRTSLSYLALAFVALQQVAAFTGSCQPAFARTFSNAARSMSAVVEAPTETSSSDALGNKIR